MVKRELGYTGAPHTRHVKLNEGQKDTAINF